MIISDKYIEIIKPDDWHVHLREDEMLRAVINSTSRINGRCIAMPNLSSPIISAEKCIKYKRTIQKLLGKKKLDCFVPCYLTENLDLSIFRDSLEKNIFFGAKLYPSNSTTNSEFGISNIENIYPAIEILEETNKPLLIHGEKTLSDSLEIDIFDREKIFIDEE